MGRASYKDCPACKDKETARKTCQRCNRAGRVRIKKKKKKTKK